MANNWKRVKVDFRTVKLGNFIEPIKTTYSELNDIKYSTVYGVSNTDGICITGKEASKDISKYIVLKEDCFAFNPYRINVGSIGINGKGLKGCVSPAYVVFKTNEKLNPYFLYHYLKSDYGNHLINWYGNRGGVRNALRFDDLCQIDIPDIDLSTQLSLLKEIQNYRATFDSLSHESINQTTCLTKLRQAILQEAIEGKLTADWSKENPVRKGDPDYDAEALLEKIQAEKEKLIEQGRIKKQKPLAPIKAKEVPFELPEGWVWCQPVELGLFSGGGTPSTRMKEYWNGNIPWITSKDMKVDRIKESELCITQKGVDNSNAKIIPKNTLIFVVRSGILKHSIPIALTEVPSTINQDLKAWSLFIPLMASFLQINVKGNAKRILREIVKKGMTVESFDFDKFKEFLIPLPPLAEQQAIVDRVEKFLSMVDELEKQVSERKEQSEQLMQAVLREAFEGGK
jgi:type I restriction enzyme, S subunit